MWLTEPKLTSEPARADALRCATTFRRGAPQGSNVIRCAVPTALLKTSSGAGDRHEAPRDRRPPERGEGDSRRCRLARSWRLIGSTGPRIGPADSAGAGGPDGAAPTVWSRSADRGECHTPAGRSWWSPMEAAGRLLCLLSCTHRKGGTRRQPIPLARQDLA